MPPGMPLPNPLTDGFFETGARATREVGTRGWRGGSGRGGSGRGGSGRGGSGRGVGEGLGRALDGRRRAFLHRTRACPSARFKIARRVGGFF